MPDPTTTSAPPSTSVWWRRAPELALAAVVYLPLLLTQPGQVGADTKTYLYLDPARLLADAPYLWDPGTGLGTVTHQNIGYLWPSGPFYWLFETVGSPDWIAQRIWLGTILVAAGLGVLALLRELGWAHDRPGDGRLSAPGWWNGGMALAAFAYALSPYLLAVAARISVILLPWAALPWFILYVERALRRNTWRDPAIFALIVLTVGAINFTSLFLVGLGPLLWLVWRSLVERSVDLRRAFAVVGRVGLLTLSVSAWWLAGLVLQGAYSVPIVRYTETYEAVAVASTTPEVLRGLGYWFFYGNDKLGQWVIPSVHYMRLGLPVSFALPTLALLSGALLRFRRRGFFLALIVVGAVVAVGAHPYDDPSPIGSVLRAFTRNDFGLAFRSTPRAVPLLILGTSVLLGAGLNALSDRLPRWTVPAAGLAVLLVLANLPSLFLGQMVDRNLRRPEEIPTYWQEAASFLDEQSHQTRVLELPGTDFAAYRWGNTVDPVTPGLMDRPYVARELIPLGSPVSANLVNAIDRPLQEGTFEPDALGPLARLISAGDVVLRSDLQYERFRTPRPEATWELLRAVPGLEEPIAFGEPVANTPSPGLPLVDEVELATPTDLEQPPPVAVFPVEDAPPIVRALPSESPTVLSGDGDGLVAATAAGLIDPDRAVLYSADLLTDESLTEMVLDDGARIVVTDSNRRRARRWGTIRENEGYTEQAGEQPLRYDVSDARLDVFPEVTDDSRTVSIQEGGASVTATAYGNPVTYTPGDRAAFALDGDPTTAWKVGAFSEVEGESIRVDLDRPTRLGSLTLLQPADDLANRWITGVRVSLDGEAFDVDLDERSRSAPGQLVEFEPREVERVEIEITGDNIGFRPKLSGVSAVGFAEIGLGEVSVTEFVRPPVDIVENLDEDLSGHDLSYVFQRLRNNPAEPVRDDEEPAMRRIVDLPVGRTFEVDGQARVAADADDGLVDSVLGVGEGMAATSSQRLAGDLTTRARSAIDRDPETAWSTPFAALVGQWIEIEYPEPTTVSSLDLEVIDDGRHSVPTKVRVSADDGPGQVVDLPPSPGPGDLGATVSVPIEIEPIEGRRIRMTIEEVAERTTIDWYSGLPVALPVAIAELGPPAVPESTPTADPTVIAACREDILAVDGEPIPVRLDGSPEDAVERSPLGVSTCDGEPLTLTPGTHRIESVKGSVSGVDLDRLVLDSVVTAPPARSPDAPATVEIDGETRVSYDLTVPDAAGPFWLALGQSRNEGWEATATGASLSAPTTISGFGNGWYVEPDGAGPVRIELRWTPQQLVWYAAGWSLLAVLACAVLILRGRGRAVPGEETAGAGIVVAPMDSDLPTVAPRGQALAAVGAGAVAFLVSTPAVAFLTAMAVLVALRHRRGPLYVRLLAPVLYALIAGYVMIENVVIRAPVDFGWPPQFEAAHWPGMLVVLVVAVEVGLGILRRDP